jgi:hypothetical protein
MDKNMTDKLTNGKEKASHTPNCSISEGMNRENKRQAVLKRHWL